MSGYGIMKVLSSINQFPRKFEVPQIDKTTLIGVLFNSCCSIGSPRTGCDRCDQYPKIWLRMGSWSRKVQEAGEGWGVGVDFLDIKGKV